MSGKRPYFSIIIPTYNRPQQLARCLQSLVKVTYARDRFEVIVVNDGGERPLPELIANISRAINLRVISQPNQGPATARNIGAAAAIGTYLVFTDDDCTPAHDWLDCLAEGVGEETAVGGQTINAFPENVFSTTSQLLIDYLYTYYNQPIGTFFTSNNFAVPQKLFLEVGGFDTNMPLAAGEDREFCDRWRYLGHSLRFVPEAIVTHWHWLTAGSFLRQHVNYGRGAWQYHQIRAQRKQVPLRLEPILFYLNLVRFPFGKQRFFPAVIHANLLAAAQAANAAGFLISKRKGARGKGQGGKGARRQRGKAAK